MTMYTVRGMTAQGQLHSRKFKAGSPVEAEFVRRWVESLRASTEPALREVAVLVRPHPARMDEWRQVDLSSFDHVSFYGSNPVDGESKDDYFESLYYSSAVVGLNTSAFLEGAVVGRPVHTVLLPEFHENQEGTFHFHHLMTVGDGFLTTARGLDEHVAQLAAMARGDTPARNASFVERFIRPRGRSVAATPVFVETVEALAAAPAPPRRATPIWTYLLRPVVYALVLAGRLPLLERIYWNPAKLRQLANA